MPKPTGTKSNGVAAVLTIAMFVGLVALVHSHFNSPARPTESATVVADGYMKSSAPTISQTGKDKDDWASDLDFDYPVGSWRIAGKVLGNGNTVMCRMQRDSAEGTPFAYMDGVSAGSDGMKSWALFVAGTHYPDGERPYVTMGFDGVKQKAVMSRVDGGYASIDISQQPLSVMKKLVSLLQSSKQLQVIVSSSDQATEITTVDLSDSESAFDKTGFCLKIVMEMGVNKMQGR